MLNQSLFLPKNQRYSKAHLETFHEELVLMSRHYESKDVFWRYVEIMHEVLKNLYDNEHIHQEVQKMMNKGSSNRLGLDIEILTMIDPRCTTIKVKQLVA